MDNLISIKLVLIGDSNTGKSIFTHYFSKDYKELNFKEYRPSPCAMFMTKKLVYNNKIYNLEIWDLVGDERYDALARIFFKDAKMIFIFYNTYEKQTFERAKFSVEYAKKECANKDCIYFLISNKYDIKFKSKNYENIIPDEEAIAFAEKNNLLFAHLSIFEKYSNGVNELLKKALESYFQKKDIEK